MRCHVRCHCTARLYRRWSGTLSNLLKELTTHLCKRLVAEHYAASNAHAGSDEEGALSRRRRQTGGPCVLASVGVRAGCAGCGSRTHMTL